MIVDSVLGFGRVEARPACAARPEIINISPGPISENAHTSRALGRSEHFSTQRQPLRSPTL